MTAAAELVDVRGVSYTVERTTVLAEVAGIAQTILSVRFGRSRQSAKRAPALETGRRLLTIASPQFLGAVVDAAAMLRIMLPRDPIGWMHRISAIARPQIASHVDLTFAPLDRRIPNGRRNGHCGKKADPAIA